jgi:hypothetical protein
VQPVLLEKYTRPHLDHLFCSIFERRAEMGIPLISRSVSLQTNRDDDANDTLLFRRKQFPAQGIFGSFSSLLPLS